MIKEEAENLACQEARSGEIEYYLREVTEGTRNNSENFDIVAGSIMGS